MGITPPKRECFGPFAVTNRLHVRGVAEKLRDLQWIQLLNHKRALTA
jgi:hypothetical protein